MCEVHDNRTEPITTQVYSCKTADKKAFYKLYMLRQSKKKTRFRQGVRQRTGVGNYVITSCTLPLKRFHECSLSLVELCDPGSGGGALCQFVPNPGVSREDEGVNKALKHK